MTSRGEGGMTLMEMVVGLAIFAILAGIAWPSYTGWQEREGLSSAFMQVKAALSRARASSVQQGLYWGRVTYNGNTCQRLWFGVQFNPGNATLDHQYYCESPPGDQVMDAGEIRTLRTTDLAREVAVTLSTTLPNDRVFFRKAGTASNFNINQSVTLGAGGENEVVTLLPTGRIGE
ncbi:pilus assembly FimT family protein [Thiohalorhabdus sp. Cl-TMA]|uniref:Tfp pilus assembly protein FimT/FimU n=1 Tax=Thiohalorhabdus methylotrophus TaxID=3242694 RepID=A0ABV4TWX6_9GAMM